MYLSRFVLILCIFGLCTTCAIAQSAPPSTRTITVTGSAEMELTPNEITLAISLEEYYEEEYMANKKEEEYKTLVPLARLEKELVSHLRSLGIPDSNIRVKDIGNSWRRHDDTMKQPTKLRKTFAIVVRDFAMTDRILASLDMKGVSNVWIDKLRHTREHEYRRQLKIDALRAARDKAEYLVESLGKTLGEVVSIAEVSNDNAWPPMYRSQNLVSNSAISTGDSADDAVESRKIKLRYEMGAVFEIQ